MESLKLAAIILAFGVIGVASVGIVAAVEANLPATDHSENANKPARRSGRVRLDGRSLADDGGKFSALGASLFYGAWAYKNDRPRLERNLATLCRNGFDYVRVLGVVGDPNAPDSWDGRESDWRDPDYARTIAGLTDLAYDTYGLRVEWTLIGDGQKNIPERADRFRLVDTFLAMSRGREHKIIHFGRALVPLIRFYWPASS